ncbi:MAG: tRNA (guanosine(46)-N7)-methyltransferase TrmB, partial [Sulfurovum sp.]|nr:tRNA (guanosine(46)-N7)-methyltransferase TrmB [Sulfurovum sp.]NNJ46182.1 tRNA (guanosine(46)-N7)-methyltransferase TrmB [Sulfurovum sp.]
VYKISEESILIKCAFGSFDRPEHKYILLEKESCRYFVSPPVKTTVNFDAHKKIAEQLMLVKGE